MHNHEVTARCHRKLTISRHLLMYIHLKYMFSVVPRISPTQRSYNERMIPSRVLVGIIRVSANNKTSDLSNSLLSRSLEKRQQDGLGRT